MRIVSRIEHDGGQVLALSTALSPASAAKAGIQRSFTEPGHRITPDGLVYPWIPEGMFVHDELDHARIHNRNSGTTQVYGPDFDGISLLDAMEDADVSRAWKLFQTCFSAIARSGAEAGERGEALLRDAGQSGPEAIRIADDGSILILPGALYQRALSAHGDRVERENRLEWVHPDCMRRDARANLAFLAAACAYRIAGGISPFMTSQLWQLRNADRETEATFIARLVRNAYVLPLSLIHPAVPAKLSEAVQRALTTDSPATLDAILAAADQGTGIPDPAKNRIEPSAITPAAARLKQRLSRTLFFGKHATHFLVAGIIMAFVGIFGSMYVSDLAAKPSTEGLEPGEVVTGFYDSVARLDANTVTSYATSRASSEYTNLVSGIYMTNRLIGRHENGDDFIDPARLFRDSLDCTHSVYGITRFELQETDRTEQSAGYHVSFYLFLPEETRTIEDRGESGNGAMPLTVYRYRDQCTLTLKGDRWKITGIEQLERAIVEDSGRTIFEVVAAGTGNDLPYAPELP